MYAKGGIFDSPTIAGLGEAGAEAALPLDPFWKRMDKMVEAVEAGSGSAEQAAQLDAIRRIMDGMYTLMQEGQTITIGKRDFARLVNEVS